MFDTIRHLGSYARYRAARERRERHDIAVWRELDLAPPLPPGLELQWLGTAGYRLRCQGQALYIDPYLSRAPMRSLLRGIPAMPDEALLARLLPDETVAGVLVGHCHFDHAIDAPAIARRFRAPAYGSAHLARLMALHGAPQLAVTVAAGQVYEMGPFKVRFIPSCHSKLVLGWSVPFEGELSCEHLDHLSPAAYKCGQVYAILIEVAGIRIYHQGSANLVDEAVPRGGVDLFLAGVAGRRFTRDYWPRILRRLEPQVVVASHFDDFFRPVEATAGFSANVNLSAVPEEIGRVSRDFRVVAPRVMEVLRETAFFSPSCATKSERSGSLPTCRTFDPGTAPAPAAPALRPGRCARRLRPLPSPAARSARRTGPRRSCRCAPRGTGGTGAAA
jgi:L-ascorbate metabolism protein UlaG (beta-lactamase superfamily)